MLSHSEQSEATLHEAIRLLQVLKVYANNHEFEVLTQAIESLAGLFPIGTSRPGNVEALNEYAPEPPFTEPAAEAGEAVLPQMERPPIEPSPLPSETALARAKQLNQTLYAENYLTHHRKGTPCSDLLRDELAAALHIIGPDLGGLAARALLSEVRRQVAAAASDLVLGMEAGMSLRGHARGVSRSAGIVLNRLEQVCNALTDAD